MHPALVSRAPAQALKRKCREAWQPGASGLGLANLVEY